MSSGKRASRPEPVALQVLLGRLGMTQRRLAAIVDVDPSLISRYISGARTPNVRRAREIETVLGLAPGSILWPGLEGTRDTGASA